MGSRCFCAPLPRRRSALGASAQNRRSTPKTGGRAAINPNQLPANFRFLIVRRISDRLSWVYVRTSGSGLHAFLHRGAWPSPATRTPLGALRVQGGATFEALPEAELERRAA